MNLSGHHSAANQKKFWVKLTFIFCVRRQALSQVPGQPLVDIFLRFYVQSGCINNWVPFIFDSFQTFCLTIIVIDVVP